MPDLSQKPIHERYQHLLKVISSPRFLKMQGLGNEVPFFICPFDPKDANEMSKLGKQLINQLNNKGIHVLKINLYDLAIELLKERGIWEQILEAESTISKDELKELLQGVLDPEQHLIPAIARKMRREPFDVMFITGVGEVFPYIRSHTVLNNLQSTAKHKPTVLFFPGDYSHTAEKGATLKLFGRLPDDNYYRAFNIYHVHA
ncbi:MAG: DUF1788 domain-containing protein [Anaerolineales bacterium]|jgi:hypothetical protein|nr:DUF1788 domain-containing protein [Anaerolineales bacterium]